MLSKNRIKLIRSLEMKKHRREENLFVAEGPKLVGELLAAYPCRYLAATKEWWDSPGGQKLRRATEKAAALFRKSGSTFPENRQHFPGTAGQEMPETDTVSPEELSRCSLQKHPQQVIALFRMPEESERWEDLRHTAERELCLALDGVQDPGNLGTIVRLADWFGIRHIFCSPGTADAYAPKAVQATMGSLGRVRLHYGPLETLLSAAAGSREDIPVYGTYLEGTPLREAPLENRGFLIMGNEGQGITEAVGRFVNRRLYIPPYPAGRSAEERPESLNVAIATAILCAEFRGRTTQP